MKETIAKIVGIFLLAIAMAVCIYIVFSLYRENQQLRQQIATLKEEQSKSIVLTEEATDATTQTDALSSQTTLDEIQSMTARISRIHYDSSLSLTEKTTKMEEYAVSADTLSAFRSIWETEKENNKTILGDLQLQSAYQIKNSDVYYNILSQTVIEAVMIGDLEVTVSYSIEIDGEQVGTENVSASKVGMLFSYVRNEAGTWQLRSIEELDLQSGEVVK